MKFHSPKFPWTVVLLLTLALCGCQKKAAPITSEASDNKCSFNLQMIDRAKQIWAETNQKGAGDIPAWDDLQRYLRGPQIACPSGGTYTIGPVSQPPACSIAAHNQAYLKGGITPPDAPK